MIQTALPASAALWFLPFVLPICLYAAFTDMAWMRITNPTVLALAGVYLVIGPLALPWPDYGTGYLQLIGVLILGIALNAAGLVGAGDAKFAAAAAPFIAPGDARLIVLLFAAVLLGAVAAHRGARVVGLSQLAPGWQSWHETRRFPMGLALGGTLGFYLVLAVF